MKWLSNIRFKFKYGFLSLSGVVIVGMLFQWVYLGASSSHEKTEIPQKTAPQIVNKTPDFLKGAEAWSDSIMRTMTHEQKIAQFFMVAAYSDKRNNEKVLKELITKNEIGGLIFFQGDSSSQKLMTQKLQQVTKVPLLIGMDAEWGPAMRLTGARKFPYQLTMGAAKDEKLTKELAYWIGRECADLGVHLNFAPVADVNTNPKNPIIGFRSFGENPRDVASQTVAFVEGMEHAGVLACVKHFPGHGDTDKDSHHDLPMVGQTLLQFEAVHFIPFLRSVQAGVSAVMVAHLAAPLLDSVHQVSSLSPVVIKDFLQKQLAFEGLVVSDALNMKAVADRYGPTEVVVKAFLAGNDILLFPERVGEAINAIALEVKKGNISENELNARCKKVLKAKYWAIHKQQKLKPLTQENQIDMDLRIRETIAKAVTVIRNENNILPLGDMSPKTALVIIGEAMPILENRFLDYSTADVLHINTQDMLNNMDVLLAPYQRVISVFQGAHNWHTKHFGMPEYWLEYTKNIDKNKEQIACFLANPYALTNTTAINKFDAFVLGYENSIYSQDLLPQIVVGAMPAVGKLPFTLNNFKRGFGMEYEANGRLQFVTPEELGISSDVLEKIDAAAQKGISSRAYPGCQIVAAKDGKVFYRKNFGHLDYTKNAAVNDHTEYDLASITKVASSTLSLMYLTDQGDFDVNKKLVDYLPERVSGTSYQNLVLKNILTHRSGLYSWIPFWSKTMEEKQWKTDIYQTKADELYNQKVANNLFIRQDYRDSIFKHILNKELKPGQGYLYSDLGYYFMMEIIESTSAMTLDQFTMRRFYAPMGLGMRYNPLLEASADNIAPTEDDKLFRKQLIHGYVHDQGAAMVGGVAGHAGLFSNATDLAALFQMFLNGGTYGGQKFLKDNTIAEFTKCQFCPSNRRGLGFDRPVKGGGGPTSDLATQSSYGHTGFTGTIAWADPETGINYVFLSNRVYPDAENRKLINMGTRTEIQGIIYKAAQQKQRRKRMFS